MAQLVVGLDLGNHSIKVVGLERAMRGGFLPAFFDEEPVPQDTGEDGKLLPYPARARRALEALRARGRLRADILVTGLPGELATSRVLTLPLKDPKKIALALPLELEDTVPYDLEEIAWDSLTIPRPDGDGVDVLVGLARKESVQQVLDLLGEFGAEPRYVELESLSLDQLRLQLAQDEDDSQEPAVTPGGTVIQSGPGALPAAVAMLDLGSTHANLCVARGLDVIAARTIIRGGQDLTRTLAKEFSLSLEEAEKGKLREAYLETIDASAVYPEQQRISTALKSALAPLVREIRQTIQGVVAQHRVRVRKLFLTGGASRVPNLARFLAAELNITVRPLTALDRALQPVLPPAGEAGQTETPTAPQAAAAMAYALSGLSAGRVRRINFRQGEMSYRGDYEYVVARAPQLAAGFMALALLGAFNAYARHFVIARQEAAVMQKQRDTCKSILNQPMDSAERCLAIMREKINPGVAGASAIPSRSAVDAYIQVASRMPKDVTVKVESLDVTSDKVRLKGTTDSFENVDKIVKALEGGECFKKVEKGPARQEGTKVGWSATVDLECPAPAEVPG
ncbi:MAG: pilus assembly protein PilM [Deltaproteobacteria bacterium]|nr:pilus assembly protein PilM [Deltaproteobacteria bacterium]